MSADKQKEEKNTTQIFNVIILYSHVYVLVYVYVYVCVFI